MPLPVYPVSNLPLTATIIAESYRDRNGASKCTVCYGSMKPNSPHFMPDGQTRYSFDRVSEAMDSLEGEDYTMVYERITSSSRIYLFIKDPY